MDVEDDCVLKTIFGDSLPEQWLENPDFAVYLSELGSFGVQKLAKEPSCLSEERASILEQTQDLAFHNYKTFIQTAECSREIFQDFNLVEQHLESLLKKLPNFTQSCDEFTKKAHEISASRRINSLSLQKHPQLLEILELPQLMDTCVRNSYYEEALELTNYVRRLEKKHSSIPIIMSIVKEVQESTYLMLNQLLNHLRCNIQLPTCLKVIGYLRRMDMFTEAELRIKFLQSRDIWFENILSTIPNDDAYHHINKTIEVSRVHLFDIITQYRAIFSDDDPLLSTSRDDPDINEAAIFYTWMLNKINQFITTLQNDISRGQNQGIANRLDSLLGQAMYFGLSFSRIGADFRGIIAPVFYKASVDGFINATARASKCFHESMESFTLTALFPTSSSYAAVSHDKLNPPHSLMEFHPLAIFCNNILTGFNELRLCCPLSAARKVTEVLHMACLEVVEEIATFYRAEESALTDSEQKSFVRMCTVVIEDLMPFLDRCLRSLYPSSQLSESLGCSLSQFHSKYNVGCLDKNVIGASLNEYLPSEDDSGIIFEAETVEYDGDKILQEEETKNETESYTDGGTFETNEDVSKDDETSISCQEKPEISENKRNVGCEASNDDKESSDEDKESNLKSFQENADVPKDDDISNKSSDNEVSTERLFQFSTDTD